MKTRHASVNHLVLLLSLLGSCAPTSSFIHSKVPMDKLRSVQAITNPLPRTYAVLDEGKSLYEGKGLCIRCHGRHGDGRGTAATYFDTLPRNFKNSQFWKQRKDGELFWILNNGSPGSGMLEFESLLTETEIWKILRYTETFPSTPYPTEPVERLLPLEPVSQHGAY